MGRARWPSVPADAHLARSEVTWINGESLVWRRWDAVSNGNTDTDHIANWQRMLNVTQQICLRYGEMQRFGNVVAGL